jgi:hypothetical protein
MGKKREHKDDCGKKGGCTKLITLREIPLPKITVEKLAEFAIRCAIEVYKEETFLVWANSWLSGEDRSQASACAAYRRHAYSCPAYSAYNAAYVAYRRPAETYAAADAADAASKSMDFDLLAIVNATFKT